MWKFRIIKELLVIVMLMCYCMPSVMQCSALWRWVISALIFLIHLLKNIDSKILLQRSFDQIKQKGYHVVNVDSTLCLQAPKIKPFISQMQETIAAILELDTDAVSVKATTTEQMGFVGREEGLVAYATVLLEK